MIKIISNGSKWAGEKPDSIEKLFERLETLTLDPTWEDITIENFKNETHFGGNFWEESAVFQIETTNTTLISKLTRLITKNMKTEKYKEAREQVIERDKNKEIKIGG